MNTIYYEDALKRAQKERKNLISHGRTPYLTALDDIIPEAAFAHGSDLGLMEIPVEFIAGTKTKARENAFSAGYMPLLDIDSEFADKWLQLCQAHLEEGIRDPVKAYEYLNRYYIAEGNKRVSVLKYFGATQVTGHVIHVPVERNENTDLYFEWLDFFRLSRVNFIEFTQNGSYKKLQQLVGKDEEQTWTEDDRRTFSSAYHFFRRQYESMGGSTLHETPGDAMLAYMEIYGYPSLLGGNRNDVRVSLAKAWEEIVLRQEEKPVELKLTSDNKKNGIISKVLSVSEPKRINTAFIHDGDPETSAWTRGHERGRKYVQRVLDDRIHTASFFNALSADPVETISRAIENGCSMIFTTSPRLIEASLQAAIAHPETIIFNCSLNTPHRYIRTYYSRMYEVKFIIGAIAGALAGNDPLGYLADYPIFGQIAGINAFALGAQMVNPRAHVFLEWSTVGGSESALNRLSSQGIRLISSQDLIRMGREGSASLGLSLISGGEMTNLATPLWQWGSYYEQLIRSFRDHTIHHVYSSSSRALNYYWGLSEGVVSLQCSDALPPGIRKLAASLQSGICSGQCEPFRGPIFDQAGSLMLPDDRSLTPEQIISMDFLVENVSGGIPDYEDLTDLGKATVDRMGIPLSLIRRRS